MKKKLLYTLILISGLLAFSVTVYFDVTEHFYTSEPLPAGIAPTLEELQANTIEKNSWNSKMDKLKAYFNISYALSLCLVIAGLLGLFFKPMGRDKS